MKQRKRMKAKADSYVNRCGVFHAVWGAHTRLEVVFTGDFKAVRRAIKNHKSMGLHLL